MLGCKENNNTFMLQMILIKAKKQDSEISLEEDLNLEIYFKKPKEEKITCFIPRKDKDGFYKVKCSMQYGGEVEVGAQANGVAYIGEKKAKIVFRGILIPPTVIDQCTDE